MTSTRTRLSKRLTPDLYHSGSEMRIPPVDEHISDRIRADFLAPRMFVPQHMVAQCRPTFVPIDTEDPALDGYPNIEMQGEYSRYVIPPLDEPLSDRIARVTYDSDGINDEMGQGPDESGENDYLPLDMGSLADPLQAAVPFQTPATRLGPRLEKADSDPPARQGLLGDYIRSFSLRHKDKIISDDQALSITYPLYHIDKRYGGSATTAPRRRTRRYRRTTTNTIKVNSPHRPQQHQSNHITPRKTRRKTRLHQTRRARANI